MAIIEATVLEKWTKNPINNAVVWINDIETTKTNREGRFAINLARGTYNLCVTKHNYEDNCQTVRVVGNTEIKTIWLTPLFYAL